MCVATGSSKEDTTLPEGLQSWNKERNADVKPPTPVENTKTAESTESTEKKS